MARTEQDEVQTSKAAPEVRMLEAAMWMEALCGPQEKSRNSWVDWEWREPCCGKNRIVPLLFFRSRS